MTEIEKKERHRRQAIEYYRKRHKGELKTRGRFSETHYKNSKEENFIQAVIELAMSMNLNVFVITDNSMGVVNNDNKTIIEMLNNYVKIKG